VATEAAEPEAQPSPEPEPDPEPELEPTLVTAAGATAAARTAPAVVHDTVADHDSHVVEVARPRQTSPVRVAVLLLLIAGAILFFLNVDNRSARVDSANTAIDQQQVSNTTLPVGETIPATEPPATGPPATEPPSTAAPTTAAPTTVAPTTAPPATTPTTATPAPAAGPTPAPPNSYVANLETCHQAANGGLTATGTIRNQGGAVTNYRITVSFVTFDANNNEVPVAQATAEARGVAPNQQTSWTASGSSSADLRHQRSGCRIAGVETIP
jgi:hypothetical protein